MKNYISDYDKKTTTLFHQTQSLLSVAFENAASVRNLYEPFIATYDKNPYTDVDVLVKRLMNFW
jgi:hypothetical protein